MQNILQIVIPNSKIDNYLSPGNRTMGIEIHLFFHQMLAKEQGSKKDLTKAYDWLST